MASAIKGTHQRELSSDFNSDVAKAVALIASVVGILVAGTYLGQHFGSAAAGFFVTGTIEGTLGAILFGYFMYNKWKKESPLAT